MRKKKWRARWWHTLLCLKSAASTWGQFGSWENIPCVHGKSEAPFGPYLLLAWWSGGGGCATCVGSWNSYTSVSSECWSSMCWSYSHLFLPTVRIDLSVLNLWRVLMRCKCLWDCRIMRMLRSFAIRNWCIWHDRWWKNIVFKEFLWRKVVCCIDIIWVFWRRLIFDFDK